MEVLSSCVMVLVYLWSICCIEYDVKDGCCIEVVVIRTTATACDGVGVTLLTVIEKISHL